MLVAVVIAVFVASVLWVREFRTPPDTASQRRLMRELARHGCELYESSDN